MSVLLTIRESAIFGEIVSVLRNAHDAHERALKVDFLTQYKGAIVGKTRAFDLEFLQIVSVFVSVLRSRKRSRKFTFIVSVRNEKKMYGARGRAGGPPAC